MALALECPACGAKHRVENLPDTPTFRCDRCGQVLKMPTPVTTGGPPPPPRPVASSGTAPVAPPPRRRTETEAPGPAPATRTTSAAAVSATVAATSAPVDDAGPARPAGPTRRARGAPAPAKPKKNVAWYWRLVAWIVAVPLGFVITAWPAYELGFIKKDDVLDIFVGTGTSRYVRLAIATAVWALVTALLVQLFVEGGRALAARRRAKQARA
jgi:hypothetical protein